MITNPYLAGPTVLVVDDNPEIADALAFFLTDLGLSVVVAADGSAAIALLEPGHTISTLITDLTMPGTIDGLHLAEAAHALSPAISVILISGTEPAPERMPNYVQFIAKPFSMHQIAALLGLDI